MVNAVVDHLKQIVRSTVIQVKMVSLITTTLQRGEPVTSVSFNPNKPGALLRGAIVKKTKHCS